MIQPIYMYNQQLGLQRVHTTLTSVFDGQSSTCLMIRRTFNAFRNNESCQLLYFLEKHISACPKVLFLKNGTTLIAFSVYEFCVSWPSKASAVRTSFGFIVQVAPKTRQFDGHISAEKKVRQAKQDVIFYILLILYSMFHAAK